MKASFLSAVVGAGLTHALPTIEAVGNKFFTSNGDQFFLKGVAYQLTPADPLIDTEQCKRDAALMEKLGANSIRVYHVDPSANHDGCMEVFEKAGIYPLIDLDTFDTYILPNDPWWNQTQHDRYAEVMDAFIKYDNVLGFFIGNEIIIQADQSQAAPYIKAATRDMKAYRDRKKYRKVPVGYSAADIAELRPMLQDYLTCGGNSSENVDFFALNSYEWCDPTRYAESGYANLQSMAKDFPVPIFFSETGCNVPGPRLFGDQNAIFGPEMVNDWSGALIYEWIEEENHYGLISYGPKLEPTATGSNIEGGFTRAGVPTPVLPDFTNLQSQWATITPTGIKRSDYDPKHVSTRACPTSGVQGWLINGNVPLPTIGETLTTNAPKPATTNAPKPATTNAPKPATTDAPKSATTDAPKPAATKEVEFSQPAGSASPNPTRNPAPMNKELTGMSAGLVGVMLFFTFWL